MPFKGQTIFLEKRMELKKTEFQEGTKCLWVTCDGLVSHSGGSYNIPSSFKLKELQNDKLQLDRSLCPSADFTFLQVWGGGGV